MKKLLCTAIFVLAFCAVSFAQNNQSEFCPKIYIDGPSGLANPGEIVSYTFRIDDKGKDLKLEYIWSVSSGKIVEGQGTEHVKVEQPQSADLTVTIELRGLPQGCPNTFSEHSYGDPLPEAKKIDEFSGSISKIEKSRIDAIVKAIRDDPNAQLYIMVEFKEKTSSQTKNKREKEISNILVKENEIQADRITIVRVPADKDLTQIWLVPAGATPPTSDNY